MKPRTYVNRPQPESVDDDDEQHEAAATWGERDPRVLQQRARPGIAYRVGYAAPYLLITAAITLPIGAIVFAVTYYMRTR